MTGTTEGSRNRNITPLLSPKSPRLRLMTANVVVHIGVHFIGGSGRARDGTSVAFQKEVATTLTASPAHLVLGTVVLVVTRVEAHTLAAPALPFGRLFE